MIQLDQFSQVASMGGRIELSDNSKGEPVLRTARDGFKGKVLSVLSNIPLLKDLRVVKDYIQQVQTNNAKVLGVFLHALSVSFGVKAAECAIARNNIDLTGNTPLSLRKIESVKNDAKTLPLSGFKNLSNTCYANSSLKFLILSIGGDALLKHLDSLRESIKKDIENEKNTEGEKKLNALDNFVEVIKNSYSSSKPLNAELEEFFNSLQELEGFNTKDEKGNYTFKIIGQQNDAQEFIAKLSTLFHLDKMDAHSAKLQETYVKGDKQRPSDSKATLAYSQDVTAIDPNMSLQDILDQTCKSEEMEMKFGQDDTENSAVVKTKQWTVPDLEKCERFNLHINTLSYDVEADKLRKVILTEAKFTDVVKLPILDEKTGKTYTVKLEPTEVIIQKGSAGSGHYYMYSKQENGPWVKHDDSSVYTAENGIKSGEQAKFISFKVIRDIPAG